MADDTQQEVFDVPFSLEGDTDDGYAGGGFEGDSLEIVTAKEDEDTNLTDDETGDEDADRRRSSYAAAAKKAEEEAAAKAAEAAKPAQEDVGTAVAKALKGVTDTFGAQLNHMNNEFNEKLEKVAGAMQKAAEPAPVIPDAPTNEEWEADANAAATKLAERNEALKAAEAGPEKPAVAEAETAQEAGTLTPAQLKTAQEESYDGAVTAVPDIGAEGSRAREVFTGVYFNPKYKLNKNPNGPTLAAMATNYILQQEALQAEAKGSGDVDLSAITDEDAQVEAAQKIISDARAKKHGMTKSGKKISGDPKNLSAEEKAAARTLGVSDAAYADGKASIL